MLVQDMALKGTLGEVSNEEKIVSTTSWMYQQSNTFHVSRFNDYCGRNALTFSAIKECIII